MDLLENNLNDMNQSLSRLLERAGSLNRSLLFNMSSDSEISTSQTSSPSSFGNQSNDSSSLSTRSDPPISGESHSEESHSGASHSTVSPSAVSHSDASHSEGSHSEGSHSDHPSHEGSSETVLYNVEMTDMENSHSSQEGAAGGQNEPIRLDEPVEVINLDETAYQDNEVEYVRTFRNEAPVLIDLCQSMEEPPPAFSTPRLRRSQEGRPQRTRSHGSRSHGSDSPRSRSRRSPRTPDHSYAGEPPVQIVEPPDEPITSSSAANSSLGTVGICSICLESYLRRKPYSTICGHVFCYGCISTAIAQKHQCPLCRRKLNTKSIHPIHL